MASSRPDGRRDNGGSRSSDTEPFPAMPDYSAAGPSTNTFTTTTTTTTTVPSRGTPYTITSTQPWAQAHNQPSNQVPVTVVTPPDQTTYAPTTRTTVSIPQVPRNRPIGIRRLPSATFSRARDGDVTPGTVSGDVSRSSSLRGRSSSAPQHANLDIAGPSGGSTRQTPRNSLLPTVTESSAGGRDTLGEPSPSGTSRRRSVGNAARSVLSRFSDHSRERAEYQGEEYGSDVVDLLDVLDPEVSTLTTLTNVQNSLFVPDLGKWLNRRPTYELSRPSTVRGRRETMEEKATPGLLPIPSETPPEEELPGEVGEEPTGTGTPMQRTWSWQRKAANLERTHSISSVVSESHYAVLPHGVRLDGWTDEDKEALDDHVRHMLHSKRSKFKQSMVAFGKYISKPLGFFVTLYATLITLFGLAWVLFLIGWIYVGHRQFYIENIIDNVLVALFAVMGDGLAPFRMVDTYHMIFIAHYHHLTWRLRREKGLPKLHDHNDLPRPLEKEVDPETGNPEESEFSVLNRKQQQKLIHHQAKFSKSHSFYKPHETGTHYAFPLRLLVAIVVLLDCHSMFQIALGTCTWAIDYRTRPQALTATILSCSITCNITAGVLIAVGDRKTRKKDVAEMLKRQELTTAAIEKVEKHRREREERLRQAENQENFEVIDEETAEQMRSESRPPH
ncbi:hypothetical protein A1O3_00154 [Capronia epimyces CBS 606.96]|uniref:Integral membrane protein n=1 Tax=Capronia epimyces CBS 606.96 TaxID=1182542 RepID=W9YQR3_9EURO|nr:uncharacterized protein A1O3_00154 [Capronia epimyces CBS 606.96]EXJ91606.1 hypothetical protein A1O3_00154 [Capronia epimyces CBS 606.96]